MKPAARYDNEQQEPDLEEDDEPDKFSGQTIRPRLLAMVMTGGSKSPDRRQAVTETWVMLEILPSSTYCADLISPLFFSLKCRVQM